MKTETAASEADTLALTRAALASALAVLDAAADLAVDLIEAGRPDEAGLVLRALRRRMRGQYGDDTLH